MATKTTKTTDAPVVEFSEYKGHPLVVLGGDLRFPFRFGVGKAKLLLEAMSAMGADGFEKMLADFVAKAADAGDAPDA